MTYRLLSGGLIAGFAAGLVAALLHFAFVQDLILLSEQYETGALTHFAAGHETPAASAHDGGSHDHGGGGEAEGSPLQRNALTLVFTCLIYVAYGLILIAGFGLAERFGIKIDVREGIFWGVAGFAAFQLAPAIGLAPELPGTIAADLTARQIWWLGTVIATAGGLALVAYGPGVATSLLGVALLAVPHIVGAPEIDAFHGVVPPEVAAAFSARVLGVGLVVWAVLGGLAGRLWSARPN